MKVALDLSLTPAQIAEAFCDLDDEQQADVFIAIAERIAGWDAFARHGQMVAVGRHLAECSCSTSGARQVVEDLYEGLRSASAVGSAA